MTKQDSPVIFLMGPTASGKTEVASKLYDHFPIELVSVDAAQVYRGMDIGTAKPDQEFLQRFPHHLINIRSLDEPYSAAEFVNDGRRLIKEIHARNRVPLLVGGTMFYFNALEKGLSNLPSADPQTRARIESEICQQGLSKVYRDLEKIDPVAAARMSPQDGQRIQRAMEIYRLTGTPPSQLMTAARGLDCHLVKLTLFCGNRATLHGRIADRFSMMIERGLVDEVRSLGAGHQDAWKLPAMRTVGYRQVVDYLGQQVDFNEMIDNGIAATRQLAKRQLTWLRQQSGLVWFEAEAQLPVDPVAEFLQATFPDKLC